MKRLRGPHVASGPWFGDPWSRQIGERCLQKYLPITGKLISITSYLQQKSVDYRSHLTMANNWTSKKGTLFRKQTQLPSQKNFGVRVETNIPKNSKAIIMLALWPGRFLLHYKGIENDQTIFGIVKFAVSQWPNSHTCKFFLCETRPYRGNAILEILYSRLKKIIRESRMLVDKKASDFVLSWPFVQKFVAGIGRGNAFPHQSCRKTDSPTRISTLELPVSL